MKKLFIITIICMVLLVGTASAFLNVKEDIQFGEGISEYGKIEIRDWWGLSARAEIELKENTELCPVTGCSANQSITMYQDGVLIEDIRFIIIQGHDILDYQFRYKINNEWVEYKLGEEVKGNRNGIVYEVELTGTLEGFSSVDWQIKSQGFWIEVWAVWTSALNDGLFAYYPFEDASGTNLKDVIAGQHNGTLTGTQNWTTNGGIIGDSFRFNGVDASFNISDNAVFDLDNFTLSTWINLRNTIGNNQYISKGNETIDTDFLQFNSGLTASVSGRVQIDGTSIDKVLGTLSIDNWEHMVIVYNGGVNVTYYLNGTAVANGTISGTFDNEDNLNFGFCSSACGGITHSNTSLDEIGFWNRSLTDAEVAQLYNNGNGITHTENVPLLVSVVLNSPENNIEFSSTGVIEFNATFTPNLGNLTNATLFIWDSDLDVINETTNIITGNIENKTNFNINLSNTGILTWNVLGCVENLTDTLCSYAESNRTFTILPYVINSTSFNVETTEGSIEAFELNITVSEGLQVSSSILIYNNTNFTGTIFNIGGNEYSLSNSFTIPDVVGTVNNSFFWSIVTSDGSERNSTTNNQTVFSLSLDDCSTNTINLFNFTIVDEETQELILENTTLELAVNIFSFDESVSILNLSTLNNTNPFPICLNANITGSTKYSLILVAKYEVSDPEHAVESYNIINSTLDNETQFQNIILYDLLSSDSTEFQLTFKGSDFVAVEGALINLQRQYIQENAFKTVELPLTDSNGQTVIHMVRNDILYNIEVTKQGIVLGSFQNIIAFCDDITIGDCKINLDAFSTEEEIFDYDAELGIVFTPPTFNNETREIRIDYLTPDGTTKTVNLEVTKNDIFGNTSVCNNSLTSSGGTLSCVVPSYVDDATVNILLSVEGKEVIRDSVILSFAGYGTMGYFIAFIFMLAFILMFSDSKSGILIGMFLGFVSSISMGLLQGKIIGIGASGIWLLVIIILMIWKLNKTRED